MALKNAEFPNSKGWSFGKPYEDGSFDWFDGEEPILEELIDACGDDFKWLQKGDGWWECCGETESFDNETGSTPTEAVANLWLALNSK